MSLFVSIAAIVVSIEGLPKEKVPAGADFFYSFVNICPSRTADLLYSTFKSLLYFTIALDIHPPFLSVFFILSYFYSVGNTLSVVVIYRKLYKKSTVFMYLLVLSVVDSLVLIVDVSFW